MKIGKVIRILENKNFGFIRSGGSDYFLHVTDFQGNWKHLEDLVLAGDRPNVQFEGKKTEKGLRATEVNLVE